MRKPPLTASPATVLTPGDPGRLLETLLITFTDPYCSKQTNPTTTSILAFRLRSLLPRQHSQLAVVEGHLLANSRRRLTKVLMGRSRRSQRHILPVQRDVQSCFAPDVVVSAEAFVAAECSRAEEGRGGVCVGVEGGQVLAAVRFIRCGARASARRRWGHQGGCRSTYDGAGVG